MLIGLGVVMRLGVVYLMLVLVYLLGLGVVLVRLDVCVFVWVGKLTRVGLCCYVALALRWVVCW